MGKILILANHYNTLRIFRRELIRRLARDNEIIISIPECDDENKAVLESYGAKVVFTEFERRGTNPFGDFRLLGAYKRLIRETDPDRVISYTVKCNIYGAMASKALGKPHYANITGLGTPIEKGGAVGKIVIALYRAALKKARRVFFENTGDRDRLVAEKAVRAEQTFVLPGAGVNLEEFPYMEYPAQGGETRFLFIGRIMQEKGVDELFAAIKRLRADGERFAFDFIGWQEEDYGDTVRSLEADGLIRFHGFQSDVRPFIKDCHCSVLPSWHEGMSNTLLESAACGRPIITSAVHGCMEAVEDGKTGMLVPVRDEDALYAALRRFIALPYGEKADMGRRGRVRMQEIFDKQKVVSMTVNEIFRD